MKQPVRLLLATVAVAFSWVSAVQAGIEPPEPYQEVVDNLLNAEQTYPNGKWSESSASDEYEKSSVFSNEKAATFTFYPNLLVHEGNGELEPTVIPDGPRRGDFYKVEVWWSTHPNRATNVPICINAMDENYSLEETCFEVDQRDSKVGGRWVMLGDEPFKCVPEPVFEINGGNGGQEVCAVTVKAFNGQASADAVRWTYIPPPPPPPKWPMADCPCDEYYSRAVDKYLGWGGKMLPRNNAVCTRAIRPITAALYQTRLPEDRTLNLVLAANIGLDGNMVPATNGFDDDNGGMNGENEVIHGSCFAATLVGDEQRLNDEELAGSRPIDFLIYTRGKRHLTPDEVRACKRSVRDFCIQDPRLQPSVPAE